MYTYINDQDIKQWSSVEDKEINDLFQDARKLEPRLLIYTWHAMTIKRWFKKPKPWTLYSIRVSDGSYQAHVLNFPSDVSKSSINTYLTKAQIMIYLYGFLNASNRLTQTTTNEQ